MRWYLAQRDNISLRSGSYSCAVCRHWPFLCRSLDFFNIRRRLPLVHLLLFILWRHWSWNPLRSNLDWRAAKIHLDTMIPPKLLIYRRTLSAVNLNQLQEPHRRKKSSSDIFHNGYRVRQSHHAMATQERQTGAYHSFRCCLRILFNWGKNILLTPNKCEVAELSSLALPLI